MGGGPMAHTATSASTLQFLVLPPPAWHLPQRPGKPAQGRLKLIQRSFKTNSTTRHVYLE